MDDETITRLYEELHVAHLELREKAGLHYDKAEALVGQGAYEAACPEWKQAYLAESYAGLMSEFKLGLYTRSPDVTEEKVAQLIEGRKTLDNFDRSKMN